MAFHDPTPWAGFLSMMGNPAVPRRGPYPCYPRNLRNRRVRMVSGVYDTLYPAAELKPVVDQLLSLGVPLDWTVYGTGHDLRFFSIERGFSEAFLTATRRDPFRKEIEWETANVSVGRCDWIRIDAIGDVGNNADIDAVNLWHAAGDIDFGVGIGPASEDGLPVAGVIPGSAAHSAGVRGGDLLVRVANRPIRSVVDLRDVTAELSPGQDVRIDVLREGEPLSLTGVMPESEPIFPHPPLSATVMARRSGNRIAIELRHVVRFTLLLSREMVDLDEPVVVEINGQVCHDTRPVLDPRAMLERANHDVDRRAIYEAHLEISVPPSPHGG
jgi:hypothetical protein